MGTFILGKKATPWAAPRVKPEDAGIMSAEPPIRALASDAIIVFLPIPSSVNELFLNNKGKKGKGRISTPKYLARQT